MYNEVYKNSKVRKFYNQIYDWAKSLPENVIVKKIAPDGAAYGKLLDGDIVKKLDDEIVKHTTFASRIARKVPGTTIMLEVLRAGKIVNVEITLMERQSDN